MNDFDDLRAREKNELARERDLAKAMEIIVLGARAFFEGKAVLEVRGVGSSLDIRFKLDKPRNG